MKTPPRYSCPSCRTLVEAIPQAGTHPHPGSVLLCCSCLALLVVTRWHSVRRLSLTEYDRLPHEEQSEIREARREALQPPRRA